LKPERSFHKEEAVGKKAGDPIVPTAAEVQQARRTVARLRRLAKRRHASTARSITLEGETQPIEVPAAAIEMLADAVEELAKGHAIRITSEEEEVSTQKAADLLNVSRPYLIRLLEKGEIPFRMVGTHRRLRLSDVLGYKARSDAEGERAFRELVAQAQELGMGYD
jgi:excisionase family DNA binding protein